MEKYVVNEKMRRTEDEVNDERQLIILSLKEFEKELENTKYKKKIIYFVENIEYSRAEWMGENLVGTINMPIKSKKCMQKLRFAFYVSGECLYLIGDVPAVDSLINRIKEYTFSCNLSVYGLLSILLNSLMEEDTIYLQQLEDDLMQIEESIKYDVLENIYQKLVPYRKSMMSLQAYYYQMINMAVSIRSNANDAVGEDDSLNYGLFLDRVNVLHVHVDTMCDYVRQIREMYQTQIQLRQNKAMNILAVVSAVFLPLNLIVGWYGMNFKRMPELSWRHGYALIIFISIVIAAGELIFFKRKHLL